MNYINEIIIGTPGNKETIHVELATPTENKNTLIALAGKNRSGKTHIINNVYTSIKSFNSKEKKDKNTTPHSNISTTLTSDKGIDNILLLNNINHIINQFSNIPLKEQQQKEKKDIGIENASRRASISFLKKHIKHHFNDFNEDKWAKDEAYTLEFCDKFADDLMYKCNNECPVTKTINTISNGNLYFKLDKNPNKDKKEHNFSLYLHYSDNQSLTNQSWSLGQRALFAYLCFIYHKKPNILIIDEIETFLHPEYISLLCKIIKEEIPQAIITTHHPHVIFSKEIDQCWYIELTKEETSEPNETIKHTDTSKSNIPSFARKVTNLKDDFEKISVVYNLFDNYDNHLLRLSQSTSESISRATKEKFEKIFSYSAITHSKSSKPDLQNEELAQRIKSQLNNIKDRKLKVLDLGAGYGRTFFEVTKVPNIIGNVEWAFWEPFPEIRDVLYESIDNTNPSLKIINNVSDIKDKCYDMIVISNVLHECNPNDFSAIIKIAANAINNNGQLIIIELYPLLEPEKYAVPYSDQSMKDILRECGFEAYSESINIRNASVNAYWVAAKINDNVTLDTIRTAILSEWKKISKNACCEYKGIFDLSSPGKMVSFMGELTTIASIQSFQEGQWKDLLKTEYEYLSKKENHLPKIYLP